jgi:putative transposase
MKILVDERPKGVPIAMACRVLGIARSAVYAGRRKTGAPSAERRSRKSAPQPRALCPWEREEALSLMHSPQFCDQPPRQIHQQLLDEGRYLCSPRTFYRLLASQQETAERRPQRPAQHNAIPRLLATRPNEVWTWDITKLPTVQGDYLSLYVVIDLYSRYVVTWMLSRKENSSLAQHMFGQTLGRYAIEQGTLTVHQDRGAPMTAQAFLDLLNHHDVTPSHSRPRVSNDNPVSESQFKTQKYQPDYPGTFDNFAHAQAWCERYFRWYNSEHHHSGLNGYTPAQVFTGAYLEIVRVKQQALNEAYTRTPERFVRGAPVAKLPPASMAINPIGADDNNDGCDQVNFPTLPAAYAKKNTLSEQQVS